MENLKIEIIKVLGYSLIGAFLFARFQPTQEIQKPIVEQKQESTCKAVVKKTINKDGSVDEVTEFLANNSQAQSLVVKPQKKYLAGLKYQNDFLNGKTGYELSIGRKINEDFAVIFSYNSNQVAGVGMVVNF